MLKRWLVFVVALIAAEARADGTQPIVVPVGSTIVLPDVAQPVTVEGRAMFLVTREDIDNANEVFDERNSLRAALDVCHREFLQHVRKPKATSPSWWDGGFGSAVRYGSLGLAIGGAFALGYAAASR